MKRRVRQSNSEKEESEILHSNSIIVARWSDEESKRKRQANNAKAEIVGDTQRRQRERHIRRHTQRRRIVRSVVELWLSGQVVLVVALLL